MPFIIVTMPKSDLKQIDGLIKKGLGKAAEEALVSFLAGGTQRQDLAEIAFCSWRIGRPDLGVKILNPVVRPEPRSPLHATPRELAEYAQCLVSLGAFEEGSKLLDGLDEKSFPRILFYRASVLVSQWRYGDSIPLLTRYCALPGLDAYGKLVAKVNLAAALVYEKHFVKAGYLLNELLHASHLRGHGLLLGRLLELSAENFIQQKKYGEAERFLVEAAKRLREMNGSEPIFVRMFTAFVNLWKRGTDEATLSAVQEVRREGERGGLAEVMRHCDRTIAIATQDAELLSYVYFGTPFKEYRERLVRDFGLKNRPDLKSFVWNLGTGKAKPLALNLLTGNLVGSKAGLGEGSLIHRLVAALAHDLYRPARLVSLHARIYPTHFFHPLHSPPLVNTAIARLRSWCRENRFPLLVVAKKGTYRLSASAPIVLQLPEQIEWGSKQTSLLASVKQVWPNQWFSAADALGKVKTSRSSFARTLQNAVKEGELESVGSARATRYRFKPR